MPLHAFPGHLYSRLTGPAQTAWLTALVALAYYAGCLAGFALRFPSSGISFLWPPTAVLTAALVLNPARRWTALLAGTLVAHAIAHAQNGVPASAWPIQFFGNALQAVLAALIIAPHASGDRLFTGFRGTLTFIVGACVLAPAVASIAPAWAYLGLGWAPSAWDAWRARTVSNVIASLTLLPPLLLAGQRIRCASPPVQRRTIGEAALLLTTLVGATLAATSLQPAQRAGLSLSLYAPLPFLLWAAVRLGPAGLSGALLTTVLLTMLTALRGHGPFGDLSPAESVIAVQLFTACTAVPLMLIAALTEQHRAEHRRLVEAERQNSAILRAVPDLMFVQSRDGDYLAYYAKGTAQLLMPPEAFLGRNMRDVLPAGIADQFSRAFAQVSVEEPGRLEYSLELGGDTRWYEARFIGLDGDRVLSIVRDITDRYRYESELRTSRTRYALATAAGLAGVWDLDLTTGELCAEPGLEAMLGYGPQPPGTRSRGWMELVHPADRDRFTAAITARVEGAATAMEVEHRVLHRDGSVRWFITRGDVVRADDGSAPRLVGTYTDITQRKEAEVALKDASARLTRIMRGSALAEVTASIAHELKQPLCAIAANANACLRWLDKPEASEHLRGALTDLVRDSHTASDIVSRTRELFANRSIDTGPVNLNDVVRDVLELALPRLRESSVVAELVLDDALPPVYADALQIRQVLLNLVINGVDAMRGVDAGRRRLRITSRHGHRNVLVGVRDGGDGFAGPSDREQLFEAFYTTKSEGLGLGLSISKSIIQSHGGSIWAVSNRDCGATISFRLPVQEGTRV